jgi:hypothetical protein
MITHEQPLELPAPTEAIGSDSHKYPMTTQKQSAEATNVDDQGRPEPFATILELLPDHGKQEVLHAIAEAALYDSEDQEIFHDCRLKHARLHLELEQLLERMSQFEEALEEASDESRLI